MMLYCKNFLRRVIVSNYFREESHSPHKIVFKPKKTHKITTYLFTSSTMKLHLLLLASLFNLSVGFMAELKGPLGLAECTGDEYAEFRHCLPDVTDIESEAFVNRGGMRKLNCDGCPDGAPRGTWCFTVCGSGRRRMEEGTNLRRVQADEESHAEYSLGVYNGTGDALIYAELCIECLGNVTVSHPCLGSTATMTLKVDA
jgi:hypothetical protein